MFEKPPVPQKPEALDKKWYEALEAATTIDSLKCMEGIKADRDRAQDRFLRGEDENPVLDYRLRTTDQIEQMKAQAQDASKIDALYISAEQIQTKERELVELKATIRREETNEAVKKAYVWRINEKIAELRMLLQMVPHEKVKRGRRVLAKPDPYKFSRYCDFIYGQPSKAVFAHSVLELRSACEKAVDGDSPELQQAARDLLAVLPDTSSISYDPNEYRLPAESLVKTVSEKTQAEMAGLLSGVPNKPEGEKVVAKEIVAAFETALKELNAEGWRVVEDPNRKKMAVSQSEKTVKVPPTRTDSAAKIRQLVAHEIGTHVARREHGDRSRLMLLGRGLDRYEKAEEGVATMREQGIAGEVKSFTRPDYHLAISLAKGLDGTPRDFRGVFTIMEKWWLFKKLQEGKPLETAKKEAANDAYDNCTRTFRGTDCQTPGACYTKDIVYREGNINVWRFLGKNPNDLLKLSLGKFDQSNERHLWILSQLGITDADLEELES